MSSVVRVNRSSDEDSDDGEEEDAEYGGRGLSSRVSLAAKPERKSVFKLFTRNCMILRIENRPCSPALPLKLEKCACCIFIFALQDFIATLLFTVSDRLCRQPSKPTGT